MKTGDGTHFTHIRRGTGATLVPNPYPGGTSGQLANPSTTYFEIGGMNDGITAVMIRWTDATSAATITLETTNLNPTDAPIGDAAGSIWCPEPVVITGPVGAAAGCFMLHLGNNAAKRNRLKVVTTAVTQLEIWGHGVH